MKASRSHNWIFYDGWFRSILLWVLPTLSTSKQQIIMSVALSPKVEADGPRVAQRDISCCRCQHNEHARKEDSQVHGASWVLSWWGSIPQRGQLTLPNRFVQPQFDTNIPVLWETVFTTTQRITPIIQNTQPSKHKHVTRVISFAHVLNTKSKILPEVQNPCVVQSTSLFHCYKL